MSRTMARITANVDAQRSLRQARRTFYEQQRRLGRTPTSKDFDAFVQRLLQNTRAAIDREDAKARASQSTDAPAVGNAADTSSVAVERAQSDVTGAQTDEHANSATAD